MWRFAKVLRPLGNGASMMDEGVKQNCHSTAEALINCRDSWTGKPGKPAPRCKWGPCFSHLCQKENALGAASAMHKKQMVLTIPWAVIPGESTHSCIWEKFVCKPCWASRSPLPAVASDTGSVSSRAHEQAQHSVNPPTFCYFFFYLWFALSCILKLLNSF